MPTSKISHDGWTPPGRLVRMAGASSARWRALVQMLRPYRRRWSVVAGIVLIGAALTVVGPLLVQRLIDEARAGTTQDVVFRLAVGFLIINALAQAVHVVVVGLGTTTAWRTTNDLRLRLTRHVLSLDHDFHRRHTPGELIQRVDGDVTAVSDFFGKVLPRALAAALMLVGIVAVLLANDWRLGLGMIAYVAVAVGVILLGRHRAVDESAEEMGSYARLYGGIEERLTAGEDLRANGAGAHAMWRFVGETSEVVASAVRRERAFLRMWWAVQGAVSVGSAGCVVISAVLVGRGSMTIGTAFLLLQYVLLIERPLEELVEQLETVQKANGAMVRVIALQNVRATIVDRGTVSPPPGAMSVALADVTFAYDDDAPVLHNVSLQLDAGRSLGVVGRTGSGKTTLSRLLTRLVEATDGSVTLGGVPIADIPLRELRRRVAMIPQEVELFHGTVRDNVTLFDPAPADDAVQAALTEVGLIGLAADIHRQLGAGGAGLSAGEAQLLAMARIWLRQPDVMVLDEATARVDPHTESLLESAVTELMRGRTTVIIAHRLSTLKRVDDIAVFEHGALVEHGSRQLLATDESSRFAQLLRLALEDDDALATELVP
jgi:ATP-binding cassette, subfamily B, bacterial